MLVLPLLAPIAVMAAPLPAQGRYSVILAVTTNAEGKVTDVQVSSVIDPRKGTAPLKVKVEEEWLAAARAQIEKREHAHEAKTFYTYYSYTPGIPFTGTP